ncbi:MAG: type VI secretion system lipoprotein TssJ, partial [Acetobacteraceae bacterium]|nr:type VI secretion system lipoprotein TssJ [Acetobacteraceae bacterium]
FGSDEIVIAPGETRTLKRELKKGTQFVGTVVLFRDIDRAKWRSIAPVAGSGPTALTLRIAGLTATLASG